MLSSPRSPGRDALRVVRDVDLEGVRFRVTATAVDGGGTVIHALPLSALPIAVPPPIANGTASDHKSLRSDGATTGGSGDSGSGGSGNGGLQLSVAPSEVVDVLGASVLELAVNSVSVSRREDGSAVLVLCPVFGSANSELKPNGVALSSPRKGQPSAFDVSFFHITFVY